MLRVEDYTTEQQNYFKNIEIIDKYSYIPKIYTLNLNHDIEDINLYLSYIHLFRCLKAEDTLIINFDCDGGNANTLRTFCNILESSPCKEIVGNLNTAQSAASMLLLMYCKHININKYSLLMCHNYNIGIQGKGQEVKSAIETKDTIYKSMMIESYGNIMSKIELNDLFNGKDFYFHSKEIKDRLEKYGKNKYKIYYK